MATTDMREQIITGKIMQWLGAHGQELVATDKAQVTFHLAGERVVAHVVHIYEPLPDGDAPDLTSAAGVVY